MRGKNFTLTVLLFLFVIYLIKKEKKGENYE